MKTAPGIGIQLRRGPHEGRIVMVTNQQSPRRQWNLFAIYSDDGGESWSPLREEPLLIEPVCQGSLFRLSDPLDGRRSRILARLADPRARHLGKSARLSVAGRRLKTEGLRLKD